MGKGREKGLKEMVVDDGNEVLDGADGGGGFVSDVNGEFAFTIHDNLNHVERVRTEISEGGLGCEGLDFNTELLGEDVLDDA